MAKRGNKVLLGYEDEAIGEKYKQHVDFTCNKFGGKPVSILVLNFASIGH